MAYDKTKPADNDLIADSASSLRANFEAIEQGDGGFFQDQVVLKEQGSDASDQADRAILYGKEVGSQTEVFARNDASGDAVVQLTDSGRMGSSTTPTTVQTLRYGSSTIDYNINSGTTAWAYHDGGAGVTPTADFELGTVARTATGTFEFTFDNAMANANYGVVGTVDRTAATDAKIIIVTARSTTAFTVKVIDEDGTTVNALPFTVQVLGGR